MMLKVGAILQISPSQVIVSENNPTNIPWETILNITYNEPSSFLLINTSKILSNISVSGNLGVSGNISFNEGLITTDTSKYFDDNLSWDMSDYDYSKNPFIGSSLSADKEIACKEIEQHATKTYYKSDDNIRFYIVNLEIYLTIATGNNANPDEIVVVRGRQMVPGTNLIYM